MPLVELIERYSGGTRMVREAVAGMSREQVLARPIEGKWSSLEVVAHLADFEIVGVERLTAAIAEDDPPIPGRDEKKYAARLAYHERDLEEQLRLIESCRAHMVRVLNTLTETDLSRRAIHSEEGPLSLEKLLDRSIGHVAHHVRFIHEKRRALGL